MCICNILFLKLQGGGTERIVYNEFFKNNNQNDTMTDLKNLTNTQGQYRFYFSFLSTGK